MTNITTFVMSTILSSLLYITTKAIFKVNKSNTQRLAFEKHLSTENCRLITDCVVNSTLIFLQYISVQEIIMYFISARNRFEMKMNRVKLDLSMENSSYYLIYIIPSLLRTVRLYSLSNVMN